MEKQTANRRARVAITVFFGVATVVLCVFWIRSYWRVESLQRVCLGKLAFSVVSVHGMLQWNAVNYSYYSRPVVEYESLFRSVPIQPRLFHMPPFEWAVSMKRSFIRMPHWLIVIGCAALAAAPWLSWRFSLRTLLIAATLVAVVLRFGVWLTTEPEHLSN